MKYIQYLVVISVLLSNCSVRKAPKFLKIDEIQVLAVSTDTIHLKAKAFFINENSLGGKLSADEISLYVEGKEVAKVSSKKIKVPANKNFSVPLQVVIPTHRILDQSKGGFLERMVKTLFNKKVTIQFKGTLKYEVFGIANTYKIDKVEELSLEL